MIRAFMMRRTALLVRHWFEIDLETGAMEHGARVELRLMAPEGRRGSESASQLLVIDRPVFRADLFDRLDAPPDNRQAVHFHPTFTDNEPSDRVFDRALTADPFGVLESWLRAPAALLAAGGPDAAEPADDRADDLASIAAAAPEIAAAARRLGAPECGSVDQCFEWTRDVADSVRLMASSLADESLLDRDRVRPWLAAC